MVDLAALREPIPDASAWDDLLARFPATSSERRITILDEPAFFRARPWRLRRHPTAARPPLALGLTNHVFSFGGRRLTHNPLSIVVVVVVVVIVRPRHREACACALKTNSPTAPLLLTRWTVAEILSTSPPNAKI